MTDTSRQARWQAALVVALTTCLLAVVLGIPALFFLAIVALGFVLVGQASAMPDSSVLATAARGDETGDRAGASDNSDNTTDSETTSADASSTTADSFDAGLRLERTLEETRVRPGEAVTVALSVTNEGSSVVPDIRVVDDPPATVPVTDGSSAFATAVSPGETVTHEYDLLPPRGEYEFGPATMRLRSLSATGIVTAECEPDGDTEFTCETLLDAFPFQDRTIQFVGQAPTDTGGSGIEFFSTREYRRGDPINRIDWHRYARTGNLSTVEYREERAVTIVFVIDDREASHCNVPGGGPDSFDLTLYAGSRGVVASLEDGNRTGLATLSGAAWVEPGAGNGVRRRVDDALDDASPDSGSAANREDTPTDSGSTTSHTQPVADGGSLAADLERRLPRRAQVAFCTPLLDEEAVDLVETLRTRGRAVTVISPDVTAGNGVVSSGPGARIAGLARANRIDALRGLGATVVDWDLEEPVSIALARAFRAGSAGGGSR